MKALVVCSGGLDSVTLAYKVANAGSLTSLLSFDYGQRHRKELDFARLCADQLNVKHTIIDLTQVGAQLTSALTDDIDVPDGHYAEESMKTTIVPNRNAIMMTIAYGLAATQQTVDNTDTVAMAVHGGDHFIYADCRPDFIDSFAKMQALALDDFAEVSLYTPFLNEDKTTIVRDGVKQKVPFIDTWSCYKGGKLHCGRCGTCVERREAFYLANVSDPTVYADPDFWQSVTEAHSQVQSHV